MRFARSTLLAAAFALPIGLSGCMPSGDGLDFSIRSDDGWVGLPVQQMFLRPTMDVQLLAVCFDRSCPEPAAVLTLKASGADARSLMQSFNDPKGLATLLNRRDAEDEGTTRKSIRTRAEAQGFSMSGLRAFRLSLTRSDRPERSMHAVAVAKDRGGALEVVLAVAANPEVALANAQSAAGELLN